MKDMSKWALAAAFVFLVPALRAQNAASQGNAENGKRIYMQKGCYECHGTVGQGAQANPLAPRLAPKPIPLAALIAYIRNPPGTMPPYVSRIMPDAEVADIRAYLLSIPEPPPLKSIAILNP